VSGSKQFATKAYCNVFIIGKSISYSSMMAARRILLVEDEAPIRQMFAFNLTRAGFDIDEAEACSSARTLIADSPPDPFWSTGGKSPLSKRRCPLPLKSQ
jgi:hypothetical protein